MNDEYDEDEYEDLRLRAAAQLAREFDTDISEWLV